MKRILVMMTALAIVASSCEKKTENPPVEVRITLTDGAETIAEDGITVTLMSQSTSVSYEAVTSAGVATFSVIPGLYTATVSHRATTDGEVYIYSGSAAITVTAGAENSFPLSLASSQSSQIVIKEFYSTGCPNDDGSGNFRNDAYVILYNNGDTDYDASDLVFAFALPFNGHGTNKYYGDGNELTYAAEGWIPAGYSVWWFTSPVTIPAYSQIVVSIYGAIDHTATYSNSVDLSSPEYYAMYAPEVYKNAKYAVSDNIPSSHYLNTYLYGAGNAWPLSVTSPAFYVFEHSNPEAYSQDTGNIDHTLGTSAAFNALKINSEWVVDAVEVFSTGRETNSLKRIPSAIDAGYIYVTADQGYTVYRNVDAEATEALPENEGLLVYNYAGGTTGLDEAHGNTDPSGIDAEASIAAGAHIIYRDTNNSSNDFHQRARSSLKK